MKEIFKRVSVREYTNQKVEKEKVEKLLFAGMVAPCARNQRAWEFLVVDDEKILEPLIQDLIKDGLVEKVIK